MSACEHCGGPVEPQKIRHGQPKRFCSDRCRKRACDDRNRGSCAACGAELPSRSGWAHYGRGSQGRCMDCRREQDAARHKEYVERVAQLYNEGFTYREMATVLGWSPDSRPGDLVIEARERGLVGYRRTLTQVENIKAGMAAARERAV